MNFTIPTFQVKIEIPNIAIVRPAEEPKPQPIKYTVQPNDTLNSIATTYNTTVQRIFNKNTNIDNPDVIKPGDELIIPLNDEALSERVIIEVQHPVSTQSQGSFSSGSLIAGTIGRVSPYGNCVSEPGVNSPNNGTNPISWAVLSYTPTIGATALWTYNHTGIVVGIWDNGDIEVRHQNYSYPQTRFPRSAFRGFR